MNEIMERIEAFSELQGGISARELTWAFPRKTVFRHLKQLQKEGLIEKSIESRKPGLKGRAPTLYRLRPNVRQVIMYPVRRLPGDADWFPGKRRKRITSEQIINIRLDGVDTQGRPNFKLKVKRQFKTWTRLDGEEKHAYEAKKVRDKSPKTCRSGRRVLKEA
jgi:DNA-binding transcriptional ArsR family regulator